MTWGAAPAAALLALLAFGRLAHAGGPGPQRVDPQATRQAVVPLLAAAEDRIPRASSCWGDYGQRGAPRVADLLGMQLAYFGPGENRVSGACSGDAPRRRCTVTISRSSGEDVSSLRIEYRLQGTRMSVKSMACVMTP